MNLTLSEILVGLFGASGWAVAIVKMITDAREDARKSRHDEREQREEERKARESQSKTAELLAPYILALNSDYFIDISKQIKKNTGIKDDGSPISQDELRRYRDYPAKMEEIGAQMLAGRFPRSETYDLFGIEILACDSAKFMWEGEDTHYWKVFKLLVNAMNQEKTIRDQLTNKSHLR